MLLNFLKAKIHRATVTEANLEYEGSITIDQSLLEAAGILPFEQVDVYNIANGNRLTTYAIEGEPGSGVICLNGAAAHLVSPGDKVIVVAYCQLDAAEAKNFRPRVVLMDKDNRIKDAYNVQPGKAQAPGAPLAQRK